MAINMPYLLHRKKQQWSMWLVSWLQMMSVHETGRWSGMANSGYWVKHLTRFVHWVQPLSPGMLSQVLLEHYHCRRHRALQHKNVSFSPSWLHPNPWHANIEKMEPLQTPCTSSPYPQPPSNFVILIWLQNASIIALDWAWTPATLPFFQILHFSNCGLFQDLSITFHTFTKSVSVICYIFIFTYLSCLLNAKLPKLPVGCSITWLPESYTQLPNTLCIKYDW